MRDYTLSDRVRAAHGDAWQAEGRLRTPYGGGAAELPGIRLMASGLGHPQWNNGDVTDPALVDLDAVRGWYAAREVPWGVRVPEETPRKVWPHGRHLFRKRCMGMHPETFSPVVVPAGVSLQAAAAADAQVVATVDASAFGDPVEQNLPWVQPHLGAIGFVTVLARLDGEPVGVATGVRTAGLGGESVGVFGVGVLDHARGRGIGAAVTSYAIEWGFDSGADLAWLNPDGDAAARIYRRLGFVETAGFDIYVEL